MIILMVTMFGKLWVSKETYGVPFVVSFFCPYAMKLHDLTLDARTHQAPNLPRRANGKTKSSASSDVQKAKGIKRQRAVAH